MEEKKSEQFSTRVSTKICSNMLKCMEKLGITERSEFVRLALIEYIRKVMRSK